MITSFDIGEDVYIVAKVKKINIDMNANVSYEIMIPGTTARLNAAEAELVKIPKKQSSWVEEE